MVKFSPFVTLLLLGAANAATRPGPSELEEQGGRALAYDDWSNPRGQRAYGRPDYDYAYRAGNYGRPRPDYRVGNIRKSNKRDYYLCDIAFDNLYFFCTEEEAECGLFYGNRFCDGVFTFDYTPCDEAIEQFNSVCY